MQLLLADQLGPHFAHEDELLLPLVDGQFSKRRYHRQKAHLIRYASLARAKDPGVQTLRLESYRQLEDVKGLSSVVTPTSKNFLKLANKLELEVIPGSGFASSFEDWQEFLSKAGKRLRLEDFYRFQRSRLGILVKDSEPEGGKWNFDHENRLPPPKAGLGLAAPKYFVEDEIDVQVRFELDALEKSGKASFIGSDGPRLFAGTRSQALEALEDFIENRLDLFGPYEDAIDSSDWAMAHSLLSVPINLGLLSPIEVVEAAVLAYHQGNARLESVEGFVRQIIGWRDYVWHLYWHFGEDYEQSNALGANQPIPEFLKDLKPAEVSANCVKHVVSEVERRAWVHHIPRLMILGNLALQRGFNPQATNDWFIDAFADGTPWVMPANVIGMALYADGGRMSTKPYASGGAYINKMSNLCKSCVFDPTIRVGEKACPMTAGYWAFLNRNKDLFRSNHRLSQPMAGLARLKDLDELIAQESRRESL